MRKFVLIIICLLLYGHAAFSQIVMDKPAATVNLVKPEIIMQKQLDANIQLLKQQLTALRQPVPGKEEILEEMIISKLFLQAAKKEKLNVTDSEVIAAVKSQIGAAAGTISDEQLKTLVFQQTGMPWEQYIQQGRDQLLTQKYIEFKKSDVFKNIKQPTEAEIQEIFKANSHLFMNPEMVRFSQIYRDTRNLSPDDEKKARDLMYEITRDLKNGVSKFEDMVMKYSDDIQSRYKGGDVGYLTINDTASRQMLGDALFNAAFSLGLYGVSDVIKSNVGYHIIKITEKRPRKFLELTDPVTPATKETVRDRIVSLKMLEAQQVVMQTAVEDLVKELKRTAEIKIFKDNIDINVGNLKYFKDCVN
ncbi:MAG: hypothetical protein E4H36_07525 [Spirochaetales bacterium]|nr:MAG: hypothetical protein E4H36_07525 [Spirochaetales bacterium]